MQIETLVDGPMVFLRPEGRLSEGRVLHALEKLVSDLIAQGHRLFGIDCRELSRIDAPGILLMRSLQDRLESLSGALVMFALPARIGQVLHQAQLSNVLRMAASQHEAKVVLLTYRDKLSMRSPSKVARLAHLLLNGEHPPEIGSEATISDAEALSDLARQVSALVGAISPS